MFKYMYTVMNSDIHVIFLRLARKKERKTDNYWTGIKTLLTTNGSVLPSAQLPRSLGYIHVLLINHRVFNNDSDL